MSKLLYFLVITTVMTLIALTGYTQNKQNKQKTVKQLTVKELEHEPIVIVPWGEEDVDDVINEFSLDSLDLEFGIGGDELIPASDIYSSTWSNISVNPYKQDEINDTIPISLLGFNFPLAKHYRVNSDFGQRRRRYHYGIDLKVNVGDTVVSSLGGMVRIANSKNRKSGYGCYVVIRHFNGLETFYAHLDKVLVEPDQMVTCGEVIGLGGNTGRSTGPHLHYELRYQGRPINPRDVIDFDSTLSIKNETLLLNASHFVYPKKSSRVSASKSTSTASKNSSAKSSGGVWSIKKGDTLGKVSQRTGVSIKRLCALNGIAISKKLKIGQKIKY